VGCFPLSTHFSPNHIQTIHNYLSHNTHQLSSIVHVIYHLYLLHYVLRTCPSFEYRGLLFLLSMPSSFLFFFPCPFYHIFFDRSFSNLFIFHKSMPFIFFVNNVVLINWKKNVVVCHHPKAVRHHNIESISYELTIKDVVSDKP